MAGISWVRCCLDKQTRTAIQQPSTVGGWAQVMQMFDKAEAEYAELSDKKRIVEADRAKIEKVHTRPMVSVIQG